MPAEPDIASMQERDKKRVRDEDEADEGCDDCAYLQITAEEMELLLELEAARKKEAKRLATSPTRAQTRHHAILAIIRALDQVPSSRAMSSMLRERGHHIKHSQVAIDYRTLHVRQGAREPSLFHT